MKRVIQLTNTLCHVIIGMERAGMAIDLEALAEVKQEYEQEKEELENNLSKTAKEVMGDTPINLNSPEQLSMLIYSRKVKNKNDWVSVFNLGLDDNKKPKRPKKYDKETFGKLVNFHTEVLRKTKKEICGTCEGKGKVSKQRKDGSWGAPRFICGECGGNGVVYNNLGAVAGLKITPRNVYDLSSHGFKTDKEILEERSGEATGHAKEFLTTMVRRNAVEHYLSQFVSSIERFVGGDKILHAEFMQTITATGRISSARPNLHNQPRGSTFPIKRCFVSRFRNGKIIEVDFSGLEFAVASELSGDENSRKDINEQKDIHSQTSDIIFGVRDKEHRQLAKPHTFKPLYGGQTGTPEEVKYYTAFLSTLYPGIGAWHERLRETVVKTGLVTIPSGREYDFSYVRKYNNGSVSDGTKIKNYPVQGFATADIVPLVTCQLFFLLTKHKLRARLINLVHDSNVLDSPDDEVNSCIDLIHQTFGNAREYIKEWFDYDFTVPLRYEIKVGRNWYEMEEV